MTNVPCESPQLIIDPRRLLLPSFDQFAPEATVDLACEPDRIFLHNLGFEFPVEPRSPDNYHKTSNCRSSHFSSPGILSTWTSCWLLALLSPEQSVHYRGSCKSFTGPFPSSNPWEVQLETSVPVCSRLTFEQLSQSLQSLQLEQLLQSVQLWQLEHCRTVVIPSQ